jgi:putative transposase
MQAEMSENLGYDRHASLGKNSGNYRNGSYNKKLNGDFGQKDISVPRDRNSTFDPIIVSKSERRFKGFDDKIISMYARGMFCDGRNRNPQ